jgi:GxxExxY protein
MAAEKADLFERELSDAVLAAFYGVYRTLGFGFLEAVYERSLAMDLEEAGIPFRRQVAIAVLYKGRCAGNYRADLIVPGRLLIEVKSVSTLVPAHDAQLVNYLKATGIPLGLLLNFGPRPQFRRKINLPRRQHEQSLA